MVESNGRKTSTSRPSKRHAPASFAAALALHGAALGALLAAEHYFRGQFLPTGGQVSLALVENATAIGSAGSPPQPIELTLEMPRALEQEAVEVSRIVEPEPPVLESPNEVLPEERRLVSVATPAQNPTRDVADEVSSLAEALSSEQPDEETLADRPTTSDTDTEYPRESKTPPTRSRRSAASADMRVASVEAPPARIRFVGRKNRYPEIAIRSGWEGEVMLSIRVNDAGKVIAVEVHKSSGIEVFDAEAVATAWTWRAVSDFDNGRLWATHVHQPVVFVFSER
jgi:TonB family protein